MNQIMMVLFTIRPVICHTAECDYNHNSDGPGNVNKQLFATLAMLASLGHADEKPKWELGAGLGSQTLADYRGSDHYQTYVIPIPFMVYRGDFLQADDGSIRGRFFDSRRFELDISMAGSLSGVGDDNPLREGMPELHPTGEVGPSANINLSGRDMNEGWSLRIPVRGVYAFDLDSIEVEHIGYLTNPQLTYESLDWNGWDGSLDLGVLYGSESYHGYYYDVLAPYATAERPEYEAEGGYSGSYFSVSMSKREGNVWYGGYLRYDNLSGTAFVDSPLVETHHYFTLGLGISWVLRQSRQVVPAKSQSTAD
ncbi:MipA/OmpV family protein [Gilvimarinus sp. F26214L]|uniref:MipA/OmpV family protein n=1 Tax=Gilvimarinus sp. DZF01 TaxID=3461371 RepID=UPI0040462DEF